MSDKQKLSQKLLRGTGIIFFFTIISSPLGYLVRLLYSRTLSVEMYGLFYSVLALFSLLSTYNDLGFGYSVSYLVPKFFKRKQYQKLWNVFKYDQMIEVGTSILFSIILFLIAPWLAQNYFRMQQAENLIYLLSIYFVAHGFQSALNKLFVGLQQEEMYSSMQFVRLIFTLIFSGAFWLFDMANILWYALAWSIAYLITSLLYAFLLRVKNHQFISHVSWDSVLFKKMYRFAVPTLMASTVQIFITSTDTFFLTAFHGVSAVGVYNVIKPLVGVGSIFLSPINAQFLPLVSSLAEQKAKQKLKKLIELIFKIIPFIALYFITFIIAFPTASISFLFGTKWYELARNPLVVYALSFPMMVLASYIVSVISGLGLVKERLRLSVVVAVTNLVLSAVLIKVFGVMGVAVSMVIISTLQLVLLLVLLSKQLSFKIDVLFYLKVVVFSLILVVIGRSYPPELIHFWQFLLVGGAYTVIYLLFGYILKVMEPKTVKTIINKKMG